MGRKPWLSLILGKSILIICIIAIICCIAEYVSKQILIKKGLLLPGDRTSKQVYSKKLNVWTGGLDNVDQYSFRGYNDSLVPGEMVYQGLYGLITGDSMPLAKSKAAPNVIRIMLTGGSGLRGNIQTWSAVKMWGYPEGTYDYPTSIAGKLKHLLMVKYPGTRFEVINAAVVRRLFCQNYASYYEKIHDFRPDIVINMDGFNDDAVGTDFAGQGDPYPIAAEQANEGITIEILRRSLRWGYTCMLITHSLLDTDITGQDDNGLAKIKSIMANISSRDAVRLISKLSTPAPRSIIIIPDSFLLLKPFLERNMQKQLWLIGSYAHQLRHDSIHCLFFFQPMLSRKGCQKVLSKKELALDEYLNKDFSTDYFSGDSSAMRHIMGLPEDLVEAFAHTGVAKYYTAQYYHENFINEYVSPMIDSIISAEGGEYVDIGREMRSLPDSVEFYVDYTHTTPYGNQYIAELMSKKVVAYLERKKVPRDSLK